MSAEVKLKRGWLSKDITRASQRISEWRNESTKSHSVTLAHSNEGATDTMPTGRSANNSETDKS